MEAWLFPPFGSIVTYRTARLLSTFPPMLSNLLSARSLLSHKGASKMLRATGHARMVTSDVVLTTKPGVPRQGSEKLI